MPSPEEQLSTIREVLKQHARLPGSDLPGDGDDLYAAGMSSRASVAVMLALEEAFEVEFPDSLLRRDVFQSVHSIQQAIGSLLAG